MNNELLKRVISSLIFLPFIIFIIIKGSFYFNALLFVFFLISIYEWIYITKKLSYTLIGIIFLVLSFITIYGIRFNLNYGDKYLLLILIICVGTDVGGFIIGKTLKGPKLTKISPNKTYSGMIGSFIMPFLLIYLISDKIFSILLFSLNFKIIFFIFCISSISQLGDLAISYFKRIANIKNTGNIIPGHGGLLDRIDGMIFAFPFSYIIILIFNIDIFK